MLSPSCPTCPIVPWDPIGCPSGPTPTAQTRDWWGVPWDPKVPWNYGTGWTRGTNWEVCIPGERGGPSGVGLLSRTTRGKITGRIAENMTTGKKITGRIAKNRTH